MAEVLVKDHGDVAEGRYGPEYVAIEAIATELRLANVLKRYELFARHENQSVNTPTFEDWCEMKGIKLP